MKQKSQYLFDTYCFIFTLNPTSFLSAKKKNAIPTPGICLTFFLPSQLQIIAKKKKLHWCGKKSLQKRRFYLNKKV